MHVYLASLRMDVTVNLEDGESIEGALRRFKREVLKSGHLMEIRRKQHYESSTEKRIRKDALSHRRARMARNARNQ